MKWGTSIKTIEKALNEGMHVEVRFHRKWMQNDRHWDTVESVNEYEWNGKRCKSISTYANQLDEDSFIIDEIFAE